MAARAARRIWLAPVVLWACCVACFNVCYLWPPRVDTPLVFLDRRVDTYGPDSFGWGVARVSHGM